MAVIALQNVRKTFPAPGGTLEVLGGVDLQVRSGEVVAIVGPSGCGKSTLLRIASGLERPDRGQVLFTEAREPRCGLMFQEPRLLPWLSVERNVLFPVAGTPTPELRARAERLIELVGLAGFERAFPHQLSGGMAQRVALARTLLLSPAVLLMDEPFGALDWMTKVRLQDELRQLPDFTRAATVLVTHDLEEAVFLADRVVVMSARPARACATIAIDLPAPRRRGSRTFDAFRRAVYDACFGAPPETDREPSNGEATHAAH